MRNTKKLTLDSTTDLLSYPALFDITEIPKKPEILSYTLPRVHYAHGVNALSFNITNIKTNEELIINKQLPIELISYEQDDDEVEDILLRMEGGGGIGTAWSFSADLDPEMEEGYHANFYNFEGISPEPDYFYLTPGDTEIITIFINFLVPGNYRFKIGVEYFDHEIVRTEWLDKEFSAFIFKEFQVWTPPTFEDQKLINNRICKFIGIGYYSDDDFKGYECKKNK
jgi:hypothetical protein